MLYVGQYIYLRTVKHKIFSLHLHMALNPPGYYKKFSWQNFPTTTWVWSNISYTDEWTSSQTFNYFLCIFLGKTFFSSQLVRNLDGYWSGWKL